MNLFKLTACCSSITLVLAFVACGVKAEGTRSGECIDGADNDEDGIYDCEDDDCVDSPDCALAVCTGADEVDTGGGCEVSVLNACEDYINAFNACAREAFGSEFTEIDPGSTCSVYSGETGLDAQASAVYLECLADAYRTGDCSTPATYEDIDISGCTIE